MNKRILVDTHIWLWHLNGEESLSSKIKKMIDTSAFENALYLSAISLWEIAMLASKKKINFTTSPLAWMNKALSLSNISLVPLSPEIAVESCALPGFHGDPADRLIVASAKVETLCLISRDQKIASYCKEYEMDFILG